MIDFGMTFTDEEIRRMVKLNGGDPRVRRAISECITIMDTRYESREIKLEAFQNKLTWAVAQVPEIARASSVVRVVGGYDGDADLALEYSFSETDYQVQNRVRELLSKVREDMSREIALEQRERRVLARLKAKYEK